MKEIEIEGKVYPVSFGIQAVMQLVEKYGGWAELGKAMVNQNFSVYVDMVFASIKTGSEWKDQSFDLLRPQVYEWCYANRKNESFLELVEKFAESISKYVNELKDDLQAESDKVEDVKKK